MSDTTKSYKRKYWFFKICSLLLLFLPLVVFIIIAFIRGTVTQKMSLGIGVTLCLIFTIANALFKWAPRSAIWVLIIALTAAVEKIHSTIYIVGACVIVEECVTSKLEKYYHYKYKINKEIDARISVEDVSSGTQPDSSQD